MSSAYVGTTVSTTATLTRTLASKDNFFVISIHTSSGGGTPYPTSVVTNNGGVLLPVYGTVNTTSCYKAGGGYFVSGWYYVPGTDASAPTSFIFTFNGGTPGAVFMVGSEYSGISSSSPLLVAPDPNFQSPPGNTSNAVTSAAASVTLGSAPGALVVGFSQQYAGGSGGPNLSAGTGYTLRYGTAYQFTEDKRVTADGSQTATFTDNQTSDATVTSVYVFAEQGTAPTLSAPTPSGLLATDTTATLGCTTDTTSGTLYCVVDTAANISGITAAQIKAGHNNVDAAAVAANSGAVSTTTPSVGVTGLTTGTLYSDALVQNSGSDSNVATGTFTTRLIRTVSASDALSMSDGTFRTLAIGRVTSDAITAADGTVRSLILNRLLGDTIAVLDDEGVFRFYNVTADDTTLSPSDEAFITAVRGRVAQDLATVVDEITGSVNAGGVTITQATVEDSLTLADALISSRFVFALTSEGLDVIDSASRTVLVGRVASESVDMADAILSSIMRTRYAESFATLIDDATATLTPYATYVYAPKIVFGMSKFILFGGIPTR